MSREAAALKKRIRELEEVQADLQQQFKRLVVVTSKIQSRQIEQQQTLIEIKDILKLRITHGH